jgi:hypothetical protein
MSYQTELLAETVNKKTGHLVRLSRVQVNEKVRFVVTGTGLAWIKADEDARDPDAKRYHHTEEAEARKVFDDWATAAPYRFVSSSNRQSQISRATGRRLA